MDCTFASEEEALDRIRRSQPRIIGVQVMFSMKEKALQFAGLLRKNCELLVAGGPLPTSDSGRVPLRLRRGSDWRGRADHARAGPGGAGWHRFGERSGHRFQEKRAKSNSRPARGFIEDLDSVPFPSREMFDNRAYESYYMKRFGYTTTSVMTSRGCPFQCDFCSRPVFGNRFRSRTAGNVVDEVEAVRMLGYERVWFADDCFTLDRNRLLSICDELVRRRVRVGWECLSRVDTVDLAVAERMKDGGVCSECFSESNPGMIQSSR